MAIQSDVAQRNEQHRQTASYAQTFANENLLSL